MFPCVYCTWNNNEFSIQNLTLTVNLQLPSIEAVNSEHVSMDYLPYPNKFEVGFIFEPLLKVIS